MDRPATRKSTDASNANALSTPMASLLRIYREAGFQIQTGLNSYHFRGWRDAPFTLLYRDGKIVETGGGGISLYEIPFLEHLRLTAAFKNILIIGNSFGWSTLLTGLLWPSANVAAVDCGYLPPQHWLQNLLESTVSWIAGDDRSGPIDPDFGINLTNELAQRHGLNVRAVNGRSPQDVPGVVSEHLAGPPDLVFIDGYHTPPQVLLDFDAAVRVASPDCVFLFHDVVNWKLVGSFEAIRRRPGFFGTILWRTMSGIGFMCPEKRAAEFRELLEIFNEPSEQMAALKSKLPRRMLADQVKQKVLHSRLAHGIKWLLRPK